MPKRSSGELFGHPKGLYVLFFTEMWERFSFYGMRALLVLYMTKALIYGDTHASETYGAYTGLVYATPLIGGMLADRFLGYRLAIVTGGVLMAFGQFAMVVQHPAFFYGAMALIIAGNGLFKPNISTLVGKLYPEGDDRRDGAFTIFYMGINIGAWAAPLACGWLGERAGWHWGFSLAGIGMLVGLGVFLRGQKYLGEHGLPPRREALGEPLFAGVPKLLALYAAILLFVPLAAYLVTKPDWVIRVVPYVGIAFVLYIVYQALRSPPGERGRIFLVLVLVMFSVLFWMSFEQAGSSMNLFADRHVDREILGWEVPTTWFQSINPLFIILLAIPFSVLWVQLGARHRNPSSALKFALGLIQVALGFVAMVIAAQNADENGKAHMGWLVLAYLLHTTGELCLSPVGLSMVTKLAPARLAGLMMGVWFLSNAFAYLLAGWVAGMTGEMGYGEVYRTIVFTAGAAGVLLLLLSPLLGKIERRAMQSRSRGRTGGRKD